MNEKIKNTQMEENKTVKSDNIIDNLLTDPRIAENFDQQRLAILFADINPEIIKEYGYRALISLLQYYQPIEITPKKLLKEITALQDQEEEKIDSDINILKNQIIIKEQTIDQKERYQIEIQKQMQNLQTSYEKIKIRYPIDENNANRINFIQQKNTPTLLQKLQANSIDIHQYLEMWYTAEQIITTQQIEPDAISFVNQFNTLNKTLDIDYQITIPTEKMEFADKPNNLSDIIASPTTVLAYPSVREYTNKQPDIINKLDKKIDINTKLQQDIWTKLSPKQQQEIQEAIKKNCVDNKILDPTDFNYTTTIDIKLLLISPDTIDDATKKDIQKIIDSIL